MCYPTSLLFPSWTRQVVTDVSDELAAKKAAIREARNSTKPTVPAERVMVILKADLARV